MPTKIIHKSGDTFKRAWVLSDSNGSPINISGASARFQVRDSAGEKRYEATIANSKLTLTALSGRIDLVAAYADMGLPVGTYDFEMEVTYSTGIRQTYETGQLIFTQDIAHD